MTESKFSGLREAPGRKKRAATKDAAAPERRAVGRPKSTSTDASPVTLHISRRVYKAAKGAAELYTDEPLSMIVERLMAEWVTKVSGGQIKLNV